MYRKINPEYINDIHIVRAYAVTGPLVDNSGYRLKGVNMYCLTVYRPSSYLKEVDIIIDKNSFNKFERKE